MTDSEQRKRFEACWSIDGLYTWGNSIVGTVSKAPNGLYYAHGCEDDWEDTNLGSFEKEKEARKAVEIWVKNNTDSYE